MKNRRWTPEEEEYLAENWGMVSLPGIAKKLGRSVNGIRIRAQHLALGPFLEGGDYVTMNQLLLALGTGHTSGYIQKSWVQNRGFPVHNKRRDKSIVRIVYLDEFWEWAEKNRSFVDFSKMEPLALGEEPEWVAEQRKKDYHAFRIQRKDPWTPEEDYQLKRLLEQHKFTWAEMSEKMRRSCGAIQRRISDLGLTDKPVKVKGRGQAGSWTPEMFKLLAEGIRCGDSYQAIGNKIGISEKAVRGKVYYDYLTENADKVRALMGNGEWGTGAPVPTVKQGRNLTRTKREVEHNLSVLDGLFRRRLREMKKNDPHFQRQMCQHWDEVHGCMAGEEDCDDCCSFQRIRPQYCARCGGEFLERKENRFCPACRTARLKQAQRRWARRQG